MIEWSDSFITAAERALYRELAGRYRGQGLIVDAGSFLGSSTCALCEGLGELPAPWARPVIALDRFVVNDAYITAHFLGSGRDIRMGESFLALFLENVSAHGDRLEVRCGDVMSVGRIEAPIELLALDVVKSTGINAFVLLNWFPRLLPGVSTVVQQDLHAPSHPWIAVTMGLLMDYFDIDQAQVGESASFMLMRRIPLEQLKRAAALKWRSLEGLAAVRRLRDAMPPSCGYSLRLIEAIVLKGLGRAADARGILDELLDDPAPPANEKWSQWLSMAVVSIDPGSAVRARTLSDLYMQDVCVRTGNP